MEAHIVVIDNDKSMRDLLTSCLKTRGWQVLSYPYAYIELASLEQHPPDLIVLDFNLRDNGMGWAFLQILKMDDMTAKIPILITTTARHLSSEMRDYLWTLYINVIHKPFDLSALLAIIQKTLTQASQSGVIFSDDRTLPILVVEDTEDLRDTVATILRLEGHRVVTAYNGLLALDTVSRANYTLILLDLAMPIMNGLEFVSAYDRQLRPHTPVIIMTAEDDIRLRHLPSFVVDVLHKPFEIGQLLNLVGKFAQPV